MRPVPETILTQFNAIMEKKSRPDRAPAGLPEVASVLSRLPRKMSTAGFNQAILAAKAISRTAAMIIA